MSQLSGELGQGPATAAPEESKQSRLFVGGLAGNVSGSDISDLLQKFCLTVIGEPDIRIKNVEVLPTRFAYVDVVGLPSALEKCIKTINGVKWKHSHIRLQPAKLHFTKKLAQEKAEAQLKQEAVKTLPPFKIDDDTRLKLRYRSGIGGTLRVRVVPRKVQSDKHINTRKRRRYCGRAQLLTTFDHPSPAVGDTKWFYEDFDGLTRGFVDTDTEEDSDGDGGDTMSVASSEDGSTEVESDADAADAADADADARSMSSAETGSGDDEPMGDTFGAVDLEDLVQSQQDDVDSSGSTTSWSDSDGISDLELEAVEHVNSGADSETRDAHTSPDSGDSQDDSQVVQVLTSNGSLAAVSTRSPTSEDGGDASKSTSPAATAHTSAMGKLNQASNASVTSDSSDGSGSLSASEEENHDEHARLGQGMEESKSSHSQHHGDEGETDENSDSAADGNDDHESGLSSDGDEGDKDGNDDEVVREDDDDDGHSDGGGDGDDGGDDDGDDGSESGNDSDGGAKSPSGSESDSSDDDSESEDSDESLAAPSVIQPKQAPKQSLQVVLPQVVAHGTTQDDRRAEANQRRLEAQEVNARRMREAALRQKLQHGIKIETGPSANRLTFDSDSDEEIQATTVDVGGSQTAHKLVSLLGDDSDDDGDSVASADSLFGGLGKARAALKEAAKDRNSTEGFFVRRHFEGEAGGRLLQLQQKIGNDPRFKLDERFLEDHVDEFADGGAEDTLDAELQAPDFVVPGKDGVGKDALNVSAPELDIPDPELDKERDHLLGLLGNVLFGGLETGGGQHKLSVAATLFMTRVAQKPQQLGWQPMTRFDPTQVKPVEVPDVVEQDSQVSASAQEKPKSATKPIVSTKTKKKKQAKAPAKHSAVQQNSERVFKLDRSAVSVFGRKTNNVAGSGFSVLADRTSKAPGESSGFSFNFFGAEEPKPHTSAAALPVPEATPKPVLKPFAFNFGAGAAPEADGDASETTANPKPRKKQRTSTITASEENAMKGPALLTSRPSESVLDAASRFFAPEASAPSSQAQVGEKVANYKRLDAGGEEQQSWWHRSRQRLAKDFKRKRYDARRMRRRR